MKNYDKEIHQINAKFSAIIAIVVMTLLLFLPGAIQAQVNNTTGAIAGSDYGSSELRKVIREAKSSNGLETLGSPYHGVIEEGMYSGDGKMGMFRLNASNGEMLYSDNETMLRPKNLETIMFNNDVMFVYLNNVWMQKISDIHFIKYHHKYLPGKKAKNTKELSVPNKWRRMRHYYKMDDNGKLVEISRKRAKKLGIYKNK